MKMYVIKFYIQKFDGVINFSRWQIRMNAILTQSGLKKALLGREKKSQDMKEKTWQEFVDTLKKTNSHIDFQLVRTMSNLSTSIKDKPQTS